MDANLVEDAVRKCLVSAVTNVSLTGNRRSMTPTSTDRSPQQISSTVATPVQEMMKRLSQTSPVRKFLLEYSSKRTFSKLRIY